MFLLNDIFYDFNTNHFSENSIKQIDSLIEILKQYDSLLIRVESLERSSYDYESFNYKLIKSIHMMRYLDSHGIPYKRLLPYQEIPSRVNNKCLNKHYKRHSKEYLFELIDSKAKNDD